MSINIDTFQITTKNLGLKQIKDSQGFLFGDSDVANFSTIIGHFQQNAWRNSSQLACARDKINYVDCKPYLEVSMMTSNTYTTVNRTYKGLIETLGEIGGIREIIYLACFYLYYHYQENVAKRHLLKCVYGVELRPIPKMKCCKKSKRKEVEDDRDQIERAKEPAKSGPKEHSGQEKKYKIGKKGLIVGRKMAVSAFDHFENTLCVVRLAKELNMLRLLILTMLNASQRKVLPAVVWLSEEKDIDIEKAFQNDICSGVPRLNEGEKETKINISKAIKRISEMNTLKHFAERKDLTSNDIRGNLIVTKNLQT